MPDNVETRANRAEYELCWKADTRSLHQTIDAILAQGPGAIASAARSWFDCTLAERDPARARQTAAAPSQPGEFRKFFGCTGVKNCAAWARAA
jgi:hypothetical protein